jgi:hypothetical protein
VSLGVLCVCKGGAASAERGEDDTVRGNNIMKNRILCVMFLALSVFCYTQESKDRDRPVSKYYFPENIFYADSFRDSFVQTWYGNQLDVLDNENLMKITDKNVIRFTCLRSWENQFSIKITWHDKQAELSFSMSNDTSAFVVFSLDENGNKIFEPKRIIKSFKTKISENQLAKLLKLIKQYNFYNQSTTIEESGADGDIWVIESTIDGKYKVVERESPRKGANYEIGKYLVELSGEKINKLY